MKYLTLTSILLSLSLISCAQTAENPKTIADKYWQYLQNGNLTEAEKLVSTNSRNAFADHQKRIASIAKLDNDETKTIVSTTITTINPDNNYSYTQTFNTVLVLQDGQWKIDANQSKLPPALSENEQELQKLTDNLGESMQENIESIDEAMEQGMQMLNEALHEGSKEMSDSMLNLMNKLNSTMQESIDKMKQRREQQNQAPQQTTPKPDPEQGEGMI